MFALTVTRATMLVKFVIQVNDKIILETCFSMYCIASSYIGREIRRMA